MKPTMINPGAVTKRLFDMCLNTMHHRYHCVYCIIVMYWQVYVVHVYLVFDGFIVPIKSRQSDFSGLARAIGQVAISILAERRSFSADETHDLCESGT